MLVPAKRPACATSGAVEPRQHPVRGPRVSLPAKSHPAVRSVAVEDLGEFYVSLKGEEVETPSRGHRIRIVAVAAGHVVVQRLDAPSRRMDRVPLRVLNDAAAKVQDGKRVPTSSITDNMNGPIAALLNAIPWVVVDGRPQVARIAPGYDELSATERDSAPVESLPTGWEGGTGRAFPSRA